VVVVIRVASTAVLAALGLTVLAVIAFGVVGTAPAAAPPKDAPLDELVVALELPAPGLRAGAVRGSEIVAARGLEVEIARALARRLGARSLRLVDVPNVAALTRPGPKAWDAALSGLPTDTRGGVEMSVPYVSAAPAVLLRAGLSRPRRLADLRSRQLCVVAGSPGAAAARRIHSLFAPLVATGDEELLRLVQTGRCDVAVREAPLLGVALQRLGGRHGPVAGLLDTGRTWSIALPRGSELTARVDRALVRLRADGTLGRLALRWLGFDPARLRRLR
jgi:ABC-type amino acid transport substrate-binding protein